MFATIARSLMPRNEAQTRMDLIDPAIRAAGWGDVEGSRIVVEHKITDGRLVGGGKRARSLSADFVLVYRNKKLAVIEAKAEKYSVSEGRAQAIDYAERLQVRFTYSTNGKGLYEIDTNTGKERELSIGDVPSRMSCGRAPLWPKMPGGIDLRPSPLKIAPARGSRAITKITRSSGRWTPWRRVKSGSYLHLRRVQARQPLPFSFHGSYFIVAGICRESRTAVRVFYSSPIVISSPIRLIIAFRPLTKMRSRVLIQKTSRKRGVCPKMPVSFSRSFKPLCRARMKARTLANIPKISLILSSLMSAIGAGRGMKALGVTSSNISLLRCSWG